MTADSKWQNPLLRATSSTDPKPSRSAPPPVYWGGRAPVAQPSTRTAPPPPVYWGGRIPVAQPFTGTAQVPRPPKHFPRAHQRSLQAIQPLRSFAVLQPMLEEKEDDDMDWEIPTTGGIIWDRSLMEATVKKELLEGYFSQDHFAADAGAIGNSLKNKLRHTVAKTTGADSIAAEIVTHLMGNSSKEKKILQVCRGEWSSRDLGNLSFNLSTMVDGWDYRSGVGGAATIRSVELTLMSISNRGGTFSCHFVPKTATV